MENVAESTTACLVAMVQGNLPTISLTHWIIASRTGFIAGTIATAAIFFARTRQRWLVSSVLGTVTIVVDFWVHPGHFGPVAVEAIVTGVGATVLSLLMGTVIDRARPRARAS